MNKHIIVVYDGEGTLDGVVQVDYPGTMAELLELLRPENSEYVWVDERLDDLGIPFEYVDFIVDSPRENDISFVTV